MSGTEGSGTGKDAGKRDTGLQQQARLAWDRVQSVLYPPRTPKASAEEILKAAEQVPPEGLLAAIGGSLIASILLDAAKRRRASEWTGLWLPLGLGAALFFRLLRRK